MASAALIGAGAGMIGSSIISSAASTGTTVASNNANKEIAQMNNEFNEKMLQKQMDYNKEMYNQQLGDQWSFYHDAKMNAWQMFDATNEYNSASAQRQRLEAAGLNPYLMMNGGSAGTATSTTGATGTSPTSQAVTPPTATPYSADYSGIAAGLSDALGRIQDYLTKDAPEMELTKAKAENMRIENKYKAARSVAELSQIISNTQNEKEKVALQKISTGIQKSLAASTVDVNNQRISNMQTEQGLMNVQKLMADKQLSFMDISQKLEVSQRLSQIQLALAQGQLTRKQAEHEIEKIAETQVRASLGVEQITGQQLSNQSQRQQNQFDAATFNDRVQTVKEELFNIAFDADKVGLLKTVGKGVRAAGSVAKDIYDFFK